MGLHICHNYSLDKCGKNGLFSSGISDVSWLSKDGNVRAVYSSSPETILLAKSDYSGGFSAVFFCLAAPKSPSRLVEKVVTTSAGFPASVSGGNATSGLVYTSGNAAKIRPPRTCELRTMEVIVSKRLTLPEHVTMSVEPSSRVANTEIDSLGRLLRPTLHVGTVSMVSRTLAREMTL